MGQLASGYLGPNNYPHRRCVAASADENGVWFDYTFTKPATGSVEAKHSWDGNSRRHYLRVWLVREGPRKTDARPTRRPQCSRPLSLRSGGLEDTVAYYNTPESVDGSGTSSSSMVKAALPLPTTPRVEGKGSRACGWIRQATSMAMTCWGLPKPGRWVEYVIVNPETGENQGKPPSRYFTTATSLLRAGTNSRFAGRLNLVRWPRHSPLS